MTIQRFTCIIHYAKHNCKICEELQKERQLDIDYLIEYQKTKNE